MLCSVYVCLDVCFGCRFVCFCLFFVVCFGDCVLLFCFSFVLWFGVYSLLNFVSSCLVVLRIRTLVCVSCAGFVVLVVVRLLCFCVVCVWHAVVTLCWLRFRVCVVYVLGLNVVWFSVFAVTSFADCCYFLFCFGVWRCF